MSEPETVKLDISIYIKTEDVVDTGLTVQEWNALTDKERMDIAQGNWQAMAESDMGGMNVVTDGAEGI